MVNVTLPDSIEAKLRVLARPFETREALIERMADAELARQGEGPSGRHSSDRALPALDPEMHPSLTHAKLVTASVAGRSLRRSDWNRMLDHLHVMARKKLGSFEAVKRVSTANLRPGKHTKYGYHYLPEADLSIQGVDANKAWRHALRLAQALGVGIEVTLRWRDKDGAANPGQTAMLRWVPSDPSPAADVFAEMEPFTVRRGGADDSREAIYRRAEGE